MDFGITGLWPHGYGNGYIPLALSAGSAALAAQVAGLAPASQVTGCTPLLVAPFTRPASATLPLITGGEAGTGVGAQGSPWPGTAGQAPGTAPGAVGQTPGAWPGTWGQTPGTWPGAWGQTPGTWGQTPGMWPGAWGQTPGVWGPGMGVASPVSTPAHLAQMLRMIESSYVLDEVLHAFHVDAIKRPEVAAMPAVQGMEHHSLRALHARMAAAGYLRRALAGEMTREVMAGVTAQMHTYDRELTHTLRHVREMSQHPQAAQVPELRVIQNVMGYEMQAHRMLSQQMQVTMGINLEATATPIGTAAEPPEAQVQ